jgi:cytochrome c553
MPYKIVGKCIFKKDGGAKVGCTDGDVHKYLAALHANVHKESINTLAEMHGGKADGMSIKDIAKRFKVKETEIDKQLNLGKKVEREHTNNGEIAKEIAMDHLAEFPDYYTRLAKMEKQAEDKWKKLHEVRHLIRAILAPKR